MNYISFTNAGSETLFEALARTGVDWDGTMACSASDGSCDLSAHLLADLGHFDSRDQLFARHGQTLCGTARFLAEPVLGRRTAGATAGRDSSRGPDREGASHCCSPTEPLVMTDDK